MNTITTETRISETSAFPVVNHIFNLTEENIALIRKIQKKIDKAPESFNMNVWKEVTPCGTVCCIAGWAGEILGNPHTEVENKNWTALDHYEHEQNWRDDIACAMGIEKDLERVFIAMLWPDEFRCRYNNARSREERASIAIERLDYLVQYGA